MVAHGHGHIYLPLRLVTIMGSIVALLGFLGALFVIVGKLLYPDESKGWASIIVTILFTSGLQTMFVGFWVSTWAASTCVLTINPSTYFAL